MRWLRVAWRRGYAVTAALCGLGLGAVELARGYGISSLLGALLAAGFVYGGLWVVGALGRSGVLRIR